MSQFESMSLEQLIAAKEEIDGLIDSKRNLAKNDLLAEFEEKAQRLGLNISDLLGGKAGKKKPTSKVPPKYRNPANASETWTGRGRKPTWLVAQLDQGREINDFLIS
jgi:DNA-binding protein H-NS